MTRAHHGNARLRKQVPIAANIEHQRRIVNFLEARRVRRIVESNDPDSRGGNFGEFFLREFERLSCSERLRGHRQQAGGFKFRE
jgi:hypothetical protein